MTQKPNFQNHIFICTRCSYKGEDGEQTTPEQAQELRKTLKKEILEIHPKDKVRVNASGCLGQCDNGVSCVIYPEQTWILGNDPRKPETLKQSLLNKLQKQL
ncbi:MAG: (2Fe-2S) ferredoxin domain-containing protein [Bacteriovoracaceae bacterium]